MLDWKGEEEIEDNFARPIFSSNTDFNIFSWNYKFFTFQKNIKLQTKFPPDSYRKGKGFELLAYAEQHSQPSASSPSSKSEATK